MGAPVEKYHHPIPTRRDWETPPALFAKLDAEFGFTLDACALPHNAKCAEHFTPDDDGLSREWRGVVWVNPPYGREIPKWTRKAVDASKGGALVVMLLPARTDSAWWHDDVMPNAEVRFLRGRVKFVGAPYNAPFPCCVAVFRGVPSDGRDGTP